MTGSNNRISNAWMLLPVAIVIVFAIWWTGGPVSEEDNNPPLPSATSTVSPAVTTTVTTPAPLSPTDSIESALDVILDKKAGYEHRLLAIQKLPRNLSQSQQLRLFRLVQSSKAHPTLRNDAFAALAAQRVPMKGLGSALLSMWKKGDAENSTWLNYTLQHAAAVFDQSENRQQLEDWLFAVASGMSGKQQFAGTALLSLQRLSASHPRIADRLQSITRRKILSEHQNRDPDTLVTALQVARKNGDTSVLTRARKLAVDKRAISRLRMSSIGVLGALGSRDDIALLEKLCRDSDRRVRRAARYNLRTLKKKYSL